MKIDHGRRAPEQGEREEARGREGSRLPDSLRSPALRELMDCVGDFVLVLDAELRVAMVNREAAVFFGYSEGELSGERLSLLLDKGERKRVSAFIRGTKERRSGEAAFLTRSFRRADIGFSLTPFYEAGKGKGFLFVGRLRRGGGAVAGADASFGLAARMLKGFADPLFIVDGSSRTVVDCNQSAVAVFGYPREELVGWKLLSQASSEEERDRNEEVMARADRAYATQGIFQERLFFRRKDGPALLCEFLGLPFFKADGALSFVIAMLFDRSGEGARDVRLEGLVSRAEILASDLAACVGRPTRSEATLLSSLGFTPRQIEIARLVALGAASKDIGFRLGIAESTVRNHLAVMFRKLGVSSRVGFMRVLSEKRIMID